MVKGPGGVTEEERENGIAWVNDYLLLCEQRRLEDASAYLAPGAKLTFAGGFIYSNLTDMVADAARRYQWVRKNRTDFVPRMRRQGRGADARVRHRHGGGFLHRWR